MDKIIALLGKKMILAIAGVSIVVGGMYLEVRRQGASSIVSEGAPTNTSAGTTARSDSGYINKQYDLAVGGVVGMSENWPKDVPLAYAGAMIMSALSKNDGTGKSDPTITYFTSASEKEVIDYYVKGLTTNSWKIEANADSPAGYRVITAKKDTRSFFAFISIVQHEGKTGVTSGVTF